MLGSSLLLFLFVFFLGFEGFLDQVLLHVNSYVSFILKHSCKVVSLSGNRKNFSAYYCALAVGISNSELGETPFTSEVSNHSRERTQARLLIFFILLDVEDMDSSFVRGAAYSSVGNIDGDVGDNGLVRASSQLRYHLA